MIRAFRRSAPRIHPSAFVHDCAEIIGRVTVGQQASIWPFVVLRGDVDRIVVGDRSNIQDLSVVHSRERHPTLIGRGVTVGHRAVLHGARIGDGCLIGMGSVVMEAFVGPRCLVAAGSLLLAGMKIPAGRLVRGSPARVIRPLTPKELNSLKASEISYVKLMETYRDASKGAIDRNQPEQSRFAFHVSRRKMGKRKR